MAAQQPDVIVLTDEGSCSDALERLLDMTDRRFRVAGLTSFYEYAFGWLPLNHLTPMWFLSLLHLRQRPGGGPRSGCSTSWSPASACCSPRRCCR